MQNQNIHYTRTIPALLIALLLGCFGLSPVARADDRPSIVGLWLVTSTSNAGGSLQTHTQWHSDGLEIDIADLGPGFVCQGTFTELPNGNISLFHVGWTFDSNGKPNGYFQLREKNTVGREGKRYSGTYVQKFFDQSGNFLFEDTGTLTARRLTVD